MNQVQRIEAIDILRGLALALMLLVNNPGNWSAVYAPFLHADWHGLTPTDLVFPFFLFVVGASMACSLRLQIQARGLPWFSVIKRTLLLFLIGLILHIIPFDKSPENWRILGVLQRIAVCFFIVALLITFVKQKWLTMLAGLTLVAYWLALNAFSDAPYALETNLVRYIDLSVMGSSHMWQGKGLAFDPEGIFSTISSCITVLSGYLVCMRIQRYQHASQQAVFLAKIGAVMILLGLLWSVWDPLNKSLWTSSFVLVSSGIACIILSLITFLWDINNIRFGLNALKVYGTNPIFIYVAAWVFAVALSSISVDVSGESMTVKQAVYSTLTVTMSAKLASLVYAICFCAVFYWVSLALYKKKIFIKL